MNHTWLSKGFDSRGKKRNSWHMSIHYSTTCTWIHFIASIARVYSIRLHYMPVISKTTLSAAALTAKRRIFPANSLETFLWNASIRLDRSSPMSNFSYALVISPVPCGEAMLVWQINNCPVWFERKYSCTLWIWLISVPCLFCACSLQGYRLTSGFMLINYWSLFRI